MLRSLIFEFLVPIVLFLFLRSILRGFFSPTVPRRSAQPPQPPVSPGGELKKDPVCGTYVSTSVAIRETIRGQTVYFCSPDCRDKYRSGG
jgi:YHS domain-containing protein